MKSVLMRLFALISFSLIEEIKDHALNADIIIAFHKNAIITSLYTKCRGDLFESFRIFQQAVIFSHKTKLSKKSSTSDTSSIDAAFKPIKPAPMQHFCQHPALFLA